MDRELNSLEKALRDGQSQVKQLEGTVGGAEAQLAGLRGLLVRGDELAKRGFGYKELDRLYGLLGEVAASHGLAPEEGVSQFFETVQRYEKVVSLDLEATRAEARAAQAKAEASRWEAEASRAEAQSRAHKHVIK